MLESLTRDKSVLSKYLHVVKSRWNKNNGMKNVDTYYTKIHGYSVSAYMGKNPSLTINCIKRLDLDTYEIMYEARREVEILVELIEDDYSIKLGRMKPVMQPEWATPSEFAKVLLNKTNSSQIRTPVGVINKSKGRGYDLETRDIRLANKIFNLPYVVDEIANAVKRLQVTSTPGFLFL